MVDVFILSISTKIQKLSHWYTLFLVVVVVEERIADQILAF